MSDAPEMTPEQLHRLAELALQSTEAYARAAAMAADPTAKEWLVDVPEYHAEGVHIDHFTISQQQADLDKLRAAFNPQRSDRSVDAGTFTRLTVDGTIWMTDTPAEVRDHLPADEAMGWFERPTVLIVGLGLGMVLNRAIRVHRARRIDVVERDDRILTAVGEHYRSLAQEHGVALRYHWDDIHAWTPERGSLWDVAWFDIWATINDEDMAEVRRLRNRFYRRCTWIGAWANDERVATKRRLRSGKWAY